MRGGNYRNNGTRRNENQRGRGYRRGSQFSGYQHRNKNRHANIQVSKTPVPINIPSISAEVARKESDAASTDSTRTGWDSARSNVEDASRSQPLEEEGDLSVDRWKSANKRDGARPPKVEKNGEFPSLTDADGKLGESSEKSGNASKDGKEKFDSVLREDLLFSDKDGSSMSWADMSDEGNPVEVVEHSVQLNRHHTEKSTSLRYEREDRGDYGFRSDFDDNWRGSSKPSQVTILRRQSHDHREGAVEPRHRQHAQGRDYRTSSRDHGDWKTHSHYHAQYTKLDDGRHDNHKSRGYRSGSKSHRRRSSDHQEVPERRRSNSRNRHSEDSHEVHKGHRQMKGQSERDFERGTERESTEIDEQKEHETIAPTSVENAEERTTREAEADTERIPVEKPDEKVEKEKETVEPAEAPPNPHDEKIRARGGAMHHQYHYPDQRIAMNMQHQRELQGYQVPYPAHMNPNAMYPAPQQMYQLQRMDYGMQQPRQGDFYFQPPGQIVPRQDIIQYQSEQFFRYQQELRRIQIVQQQMALQQTYPYHRGHTARQHEGTVPIQAGASNTTGRDTEPELGGAKYQNQESMPSSDVSDDMQKMEISQEEKTEDENAKGEEDVHSDTQVVVLSEGGDVESTEKESTAPEFHEKMLDSGNSKDASPESVEQEKSPADVVENWREGSGRVRPRGDHARGGASRRGNRKSGGGTNPKSPKNPRSPKSPKTPNKTSRGSGRRGGDRRSQKGEIAAENTAAESGKGNTTPKSPRRRRKPHLSKSPKGNPDEAVESLGRDSSLEGNKENDNDGGSDTKMESIINQEKPKLEGESASVATDEKVEVSLDLHTPTPSQPEDASTSPRKGGRRGGRSKGRGGGNVSKGGIKPRQQEGRRRGETRMPEERVTKYKYVKKNA